MAPSRSRTPERAVGGELAAAHHLLEAEHRAGGDLREQRLAAAGAAEQHGVDRIDPGIDADGRGGLAQMRARPARNRARPVSLCKQIDACTRDS